jgi:SAM-dependent methyltransferase
LSGHCWGPSGILCEVEIDGSQGPFVEHKGRRRSSIAAGSRHRDPHHEAPTASRPPKSDQNRYLSNVTLTEADAQTHEFEPDRFDLIASRFGVMFFADPRAAFANLLRAARPRGRLCFACWGPLEANCHWLIPYEVALRHLGPPAPKPPRAPGPMAFADPDYLRSFLGAAGFEAIKMHRETPDVFASTPQAEAEHACIMGPSGRLIDEKRPTTQLGRQFGARSGTPSPLIFGTATRDCPPPYSW